MSMKKFKDGKHILSLKPFSGLEYNEHIINQLNNIAQTYEKRVIYNRSEMIATLIKYNVPGDWVERMHKSEQFGRDSSSLESNIIRYGEKTGTKLFNEKCDKCTVTESTYIEKYGEEEGKQKWKELCTSKISFTEDHYIEKYGEQKGKQKWRDVVRRKVATWKANHEAGKFKTYMLLEDYQHKYGVEDGYKRWKRKCKNIAYGSSRQFYIDKYGKDDGVERFNKIHFDNTLSSYIEKYGEEEGKEKYNERCRNCAVTLRRMIKKYGEEEGEMRWKECLHKRSLYWQNNNIGVSKSSQRFFWQVYNKLDKRYQRECFFYEKNYEYKFYQHLPDVIKLHMVDFKCGDKIIEFDGAYWHDDVSDKNRDEFLSSIGYKVLRVSYEDFIKNTDKMINEGLEFIHEQT